MLKSAIEILNNPNATSADLRGALASLSLPRIEQHVDELEAERRRILLTGSAKERRRIDEQILNANLDAERTSVAIEELQKKITEVEASREAALRQEDITAPADFSFIQTKTAASRAARNR